MADVTRSRRQAAARAARRSEAPPAPSRPRLACVVGALLHDQPELALLASAAADVARLELVDDRFALVSTILTARPVALVIPPFDADRISTSPLVLRVRREAPDVAVLVVSEHPGGAGQPILRAAQAGAQVITAPTTDELRKALVALVEPPPSAGRPPAPD